MQKLILVFLLLILKFLYELIIKGNIETAMIRIKNIIFHSNKIVKQETPSYFIKYINRN